MPFLSVGEYEVVAAGERGAELARESFLYLPLLNLIFVLAAALGSAAFGVHFSRLLRMHPAWWLLAPVIIGLGLFDLSLFSFSGRGAPYWDLFTLTAMLEWVPLAAFLGVIVCCPRGHRIAVPLVALLVSAFLSVGLYALSLGRPISSIIGGMKAAYELCGAWLIPAAGAALLLMGRFSFRRFCARLVLLWLLMTVVRLATWSLYWHLGISATRLIYLLARPLPFLIGLLLFLRLSRWSRESFLRVLELKEETTAQNAEAVAPSSNE